MINPHAFGFGITQMNKDIQHRRARAINICGALKRLIVVIGSFI